MAQASNSVVTRHIPYGLKFDGVDGYAYRNNELAYNLGVFSIAFWIKGSAASGEDRIISEGSSLSSSPFYSIEATNPLTSKIKLAIRNDASSYLVNATTTADVLDNIWHHVVFSDDNGTVKCYIDRAEDATDFNYTRGTLTLNRFSLGCLLRSSAIAFFAGKMTRPLIFNKAISQAEVDNYFYDSVIPSGLIAEYFNSVGDDGSGASLKDSIGSNDMTISGGATWTGDTPHKQPMVAVDGFNPSCRFDGVNDSLVSTKDKSTYDIKSGVDFSLLFNFKKSIDSGVLMATGGRSGSETGICVYLSSSNTISITIGDGSSRSTFNIGTTKNLPQLNNWEDLVLKCNRATGIATVYLNSVNAGTVDVSAFDASDLNAHINLNIGAVNNVAWFKGYFKEFGVYIGKLLTQQEITDYHYHHIIPSGYTEFLKMNEGGGATTTGEKGDVFTLSGVEWDDDTPFPERQIVGGNLVKNGDFERATAEHERSTDGYIGGRPLGWNMSGSGSRSVEFALEDGKRVLKLSLTANGTSIRIRNNTDSDYGKDGFRIKPNTEYKIKFRMKLENITGDSDDGAKAIIYYSDQYGNSKSNSSLISSVKINQEWVEYEVTKTSPLGAVWANIQCRFYGNTGTGTLQGDAFFDNIEVKEV
jgi:hypothetical protein